MEQKPTISQENKLTWGPISALVISFTAYLASQVFLIIPLLLIASLTSTKNVDNSIDNSAWLNLAIGGFAAVTMILVLWLFLKKRHSNFRALGFKKFTKKDGLWIFLGIIAYFILLIIALSVANFIPGYNADQAQDVGYKSVAGWQLILAFIGLVIIPPFAEEMLFRGFLYRGLASKWPKILSALIASSLFAVAHFQWNVGIDVFVLSLVMIFVLEKTKNLWACISLHMIKNGIAFLALFVFVSH
jgi:uncharacterized protein